MLFAHCVATESICLFVLCHVYSTKLVVLEPIDDTYLHLCISRTDGSLPSVSVDGDVNLPIFSYDVRKYPPLKIWGWVRAWILS